MTIKRKYYHGTARYIGGVLYCEECRQVLDAKRPLLSDKPCVFENWITNINGFDFQISVWNCTAELLVFKENFEEGIIKRDYFELEITDEKIKELIDKYVIDSIHEIGGAINISGVYPLNEDLENLILNEWDKTIFVKEKNN